MASIVEKARVFAALTAVLTVVVAFDAPRTIAGDHYTKDAASSGNLTSYLHSHRLPLVGAEVLRGDSGSREVVLYGFVATELGKLDAEAKTRSFLNDPNLQVINRVIVSPQLSNLPPQGASAASRTGTGAADEDPISQAYDAYQQQQQSGQISAVPDASPFP